MTKVEEWYIETAEEYCELLKAVINVLPEKDIESSWLLFEQIQEASKELRKRVVNLREVL